MLINTHPKGGNMYTITQNGIQRMRFFNGKKMESKPFIKVTGQGKVTIGFEILCERSKNESVAGEFFISTTIQENFTESMPPEEEMIALYKTFLVLDDLDNLNKKAIINICYRTVKTGEVDEDWFENRENKEKLQSFLTAIRNREELI